MSPARAIGRLARRDRTVAAIVRRWRELTSGRLPSGRRGRGEPTLIACSGGADSSALALALAAAGGARNLVLAHVVHDLRPEADALADRDAVRALAARLGLPFVESLVSTRRLLIDDQPAPRNLVRRAGDRNPEGLARRLRYIALARLARHHNLRFIATAHHAGDQLESILMALVRGAGPLGLRGTAPSRRIRDQGDPVHIIRPMLDVARAECERLCHDAGWSWREDATNADTTRLRSYLRHRVIPELRAARPGVDARAAAGAELLRDAAGLIRDRARVLLAAAQIETTPRSGTPISFSWPRSLLSAERRVVIGETLRSAARRLTKGRGMDRLGRASIDAVVDAILSPARHPRRLVLYTLSVAVSARTVRLTISDSSIHKSRTQNSESEDVRRATP